EVSVCVDVARIRLKFKPRAADQLDQYSHRSENPAQLVRACRGVVDLQRQGAEYDDNELRLAVPVCSAVHARRRRPRTIMISKIINEALINQTSSGSLPFSVPSPIARSLTPNGSGDA